MKIASLCPLLVLAGCAFVAGCAQGPVADSAEYAGTSGSSGTGGVSQSGGGGGTGGSPTGAGGDNGGSPGGDSKKAGGDGNQDTEAAGEPFNPKDLKECNAPKQGVPFFFSSDDSNSMASPALAREYLSAKLAPNPAQIRTYEFLNYYNSHYKLLDPSTNELGLFAELAAAESSPSDPVQKLRLQVGVQAFAVPRPPLVLTFVIDSSGSLVGPGIERARAALLELSGALQKDDIVNAVTWSNENNILLDGYRAQGNSTDDNALATAVQKLVPGGGSDLHGGLTRGYQMAAAHFDPARLNRVVLVSDGGANLGVLDRQIIAGAAEAANAEGIYLVGIGVGPAAGYSDNLMNLVTDAGRGAYVYIDDPAEARELFHNRFDEVMNVAARNVQVEIDLPKYLEIDHFYGEGYSEQVADIDPQHLAPGDSMIFNETLYVTNKDDICGDDAIIVKVTWETPIEHKKAFVETSPLLLSELLAKPMSEQFAKANAVIAYAEALKTGKPADLTAAFAVISSARALHDDEDLKEIDELLRKHPSFP